MLLEISLTCGEITEVRKTNYYRVTKKDNEVMSTAIKFRQADIALLALEKLC